MSYTEGLQLERSAFDLLVGADGIHSAVVRALDPGLHRPVSRVLELVTSTELPALAERLGDQFIKTVFTGRGVAVGLLAPTRTRVIGFVQLDAQRHAPPSRDASPQVVREVLSSLLGSALPPPVDAWLAQVDLSTAHLWSPADADLPAQLACANAVVVGDAAHPLLPFTSQGVSAALEDAIMLADALASNELAGLPGPLGDEQRPTLAAALAGFAADRAADVRLYLDGGRAILRSFVASDGDITPSYVDGARSHLETHLSLPTGGLRGLFRILDSSGDGLLERVELRRALRWFDLGLSDAEIDAVFDEFDGDGDGHITFDELVLGLGGEARSPGVARVQGMLTPRSVALHSPRSRARAWFQILDEGGSGRIDAEAVRRAQHLLGLAEAARLTAGCGGGEGSALTEDEFVAMVDRALAGQEAPPLFSDASVKLEILRQRAYNYRWATHEPDVIPLTAADPDFPAPPAVLEAMQGYLADGYLSYGPAEGLPELREAVAARFASQGVACDASRVLALDSAASGLFLVARFAIAEPGDEAIIFDPVDFLFERSVLAAGGVVRRLPIVEGRFDVEALRRLVTPRTRLLGICSPHNPLGRVWSRAELEALTDVAREHGLWILSDEVWSDIVFAPHRHLPTAALGDEVAARTFTVYGFSKGYGMAGLRLGALLTPTAEAHARMVALSHAGDTAFGTSTLSQVGGVAALTRAGAWQEGFVAHLRAMRDLAVSRLVAIPGVRCTAPEGTFVLFADVAGVVGRDGDVEALVERLRARHRIAVVPGSPRFFGPRAAGHLRISIATSQAILTEGLDRLERGLREA